MHPDPNGLDKNNYIISCYEGDCCLLICPREPHEVLLMSRPSVTEQALTELRFVGRIANLLMICLHNIRIDLRFPSVIVYKT